MREHKATCGWGGRRRGAGRKRAPHGRRSVAHRARVAIGVLTPVHVTVKLVAGLPSLRTLHAARRLRVVFAAGCERPGFRIVHFAVMTNHVHFLAEADDATSLARGMQGLMVRMARRLNSAMNRRGRVFADRYHARALTSTLDVWRTIQYVLSNARRHGIAFPGPFDPYSSAQWFTGWRDHAPLSRPSPVAAPRSWQLRHGWWPHGRLDPWRAPFAWVREA